METIVSIVPVGNVTQTQVHIADATWLKEYDNISEAADDAAALGLLDPETAKQVRTRVDGCRNESAAINESVLSSTGFIRSGGL